MRKNNKLLSLIIALAFVTASVLGMMLTTSSAAAAQVSGLRFVQIEHGVDHTLALTADGKVYAWGDNTYGQLGIGTLSGQNWVNTSVANKLDEPTLVIDSGRLSATGDIIEANRGNDREGFFTSNTYIVKIGVGLNTSYALTNTGALLGWGRNDYLQLGLEATVTTVYGPKLASDNQETLDFAAGDNHVIFTYVDTGTYYIAGRGDNSYGQISRSRRSATYGHKRQSLERILTDSYDDDDDKTAGMFGDNANIKAARLYAVGNASFIIYDNNVYSFGQNTANALGRTTPVYSGSTASDYSNTGATLPEYSTTTGVAGMQVAGVSATYGEDYGASDFIDSKYDEITADIANKRKLTITGNNSINTAFHKSAVSAFGANASLVLHRVSSTDATLSSWGDAAYVSTAGAPAASTIKQIVMPKGLIEAGDMHTGAVLTTDGVVYAFGSTTTGAPTNFINITDALNNKFLGMTGGAIKIVYLSAGYDGKLSAIDNLGKIYTLGLDGSGKLQSAYPLTKFNNFDGTPVANMERNENVSREFSLGSVKIGNTEALSLNKGINSKTATDTPVYTMNKGALYKILEPTDDVVVSKSGGATMVEAVSGKYDPNNLLISGLPAGNNPNLSFAFEYYEGSTKVKDTYAAKYFSINFAQGTGGSQIDKDRTISLVVTPKKRTSSIWKIKVWVACYDQTGTTPGDKFYYEFTQLEYTLTGIANSGMELSGHVTTTGTQNTVSTELDINKPAENSKDYLLYDINDAIEKLLTQKGINLATVPGHENPYEHLAYDPDGDRLEIFFEESNFIKDGNRLLFPNPLFEGIFEIEKIKKTITIPNFGTSKDAIEEWLDEVFDNAYGMQIEAEGTSVKITYEFIRVISLKNSLDSSPYFDLTIRENNYGTFSAQTIRFSVKVNYSLTFETYENSPVGSPVDKSQNYVGLPLFDSGATNPYNFQTVEKTVGIITSSGNTSKLFYEGETIVLKLSSLFKDADRLKFSDNQSTYYDQSFYRAAVTARDTITIEAYGASAFNFRFEIEALDGSSYGNVEISINGAITALPPEYQLKQIKTNLGDITGSKTFELTDIIAGGYISNIGASTIKADPDIQSKLKITAAVSLNTDIASANLVTESGIKKLRLTPKIDGQSSVRVSVSYLKYSMTFDFNFTVTNLTKFNESILTVNSSRKIHIKELAAKIANNKIATVSSEVYNNLVNELKVKTELVDGVAKPKISYIDNDEANPSAVSGIVTTESYPDNEQIIIYANDRIYDLLNNKTVIYITMYDPNDITETEYEISVYVQVNKIYLAESEAQRIVIEDKQDLTVNVRDYAILVGGMPANIKLDIIKLGGILDTESYSGNRVRIESASGATSFGIKPLQNGIQEITLQLYGISSGRDPMTGEEPRFELTISVEVKGITTVLTQRQYITNFIIAGGSVLLLLFIIFIIRFSIYLKKRSEQKKLIKKNAMIIKMRDKIHQRPDQSTREQALKTKLKMEDPKYAKLMQEMKKDREGSGATVEYTEPGLSTAPGVVLTQPGDKDKNKKKKKMSAKQMREELEAKKAKLAAMQNEIPMVQMDDRAAIDEQIKAKLAQEPNAFDFDLDL